VGAEAGATGALATPARAHQPQYNCASVLASGGTIAGNAVGGGVSFNGPPPCVFVFGFNFCVQTAHAQGGGQGGLASHRRPFPPSRPPPHQANTPFHQLQPQPWYVEASVLGSGRQGQRRRGRGQRRVASACWWTSQPQEAVPSNIRLVIPPRTQPVSASLQSTEPLREHGRRWGQWGRQRGQHLEGRWHRQCGAQPVTTHTIVTAPGLRHRGPR
jgi:hypothetical protein